MTTISELPKSVRDHLPEHAQTIYREAFSDAWVQCAHDPAHEEIPHRVAWSAVKRKYCKPATAGCSRADDDGEPRWPG